MVDVSKVRGSCCGIPAECIDSNDVTDEFSIYGDGEVEDADRSVEIGREGPRFVRALFESAGLSFWPDMVRLLSKRAIWGSNDCTLISSDVFTFLELESLPLEVVMSTDPSPFE